MSKTITAAPPPSASTRAARSRRGSATHRPGRPRVPPSRRPPGWRASSSFAARHPPRGRSNGALTREAGRLDGILTPHPGYPPCGRGEGVVDVGGRQRDLRRRARTANPTRSTTPLDAASCAGGSGHGFAWIGLLPPDQAEITAVAQEFEPAPAGRRGRDARPPAAEARALRRHAVRRAAPAALPRRGRGGRVRRAARVHRAATSSSPSGTPSRPTSRAVRAPAGGATRTCCALGPQAVLYAILDQVVDDYAPGRARASRTTSTRSRTQLFGGDPSVSRRIYELSPRGHRVPARRRAARRHHRRRSARVRRSTTSTLELQRDLRDVADHVARVVERADGFRAAAAEHPAGQRHARRAAPERGDAQLTETSLAQNEEVKKISVLGGDPVRPDARRHASTA